MAERSKSGTRIPFPRSRKRDGQFIGGKVAVSKYFRERIRLSGWCRLFSLLSPATRLLDSRIAPLSTIIPRLDTRLCPRFDVQPRPVVTGVCLSSHECAYILND